MKEMGRNPRTLGFALSVLLGLAAVVAGTSGCEESPPATLGGESKTGASEPGKEKGKMPLGSKGEMAVIETNHGTIKVKFFYDVAPKAVENFLGLAAKGYYNGVTFHRVIDGFMIQGGDPTGTGAGGQSLWGKSFEDEFSPKYRFDRKGLLAMANSGPRTNGSQFFITLEPTRPPGHPTHLNDKHTIFGEVVSGMEVVEKIAKVRKGPRDKPIEPVVMKSVKVEEPKPAGANPAESKPAAEKKR